MSTAILPCDAAPMPAAIGAAADCECCSGRAHCRVGRKRGFELRQCTACRAISVWPPPSSQQLRELYQIESGYYAMMQTDLSAVPAASALWLDRVLLNAGATRGTFLDVGCSNGSLIHAMRQLGWTVTGIDINAAAIEIAQRNGLEARVASLHAADFADDCFNVVYLGDVIEHVPSPREMCREIHRILRPGGILVMRTPNATCGFAGLTLAAARTGLVSWAHSEAPYHLHEFTPLALRKLIESAGLEMLWSSCEGRGRFLYKLGAVGTFDRLKKRLRQRDSRRSALLAWTPLVLAIGALIAPAYMIGAAIDLLCGSGMSIFAGARKKPA